MQQPSAPTPPTKKGLSPVATIFIVLGVFAVLALGTCGVSAIILKRKVDSFAKEMGEGGTLVLVSPPEVKADLAGPKKDYVGSWKSARNSTLDIDADGNFRWAHDEGGAKESINAAIAEFKGNDIEVHALVRLTFPVADPPHRVDDHWSMTMKGVTFERK